MGEGVGERNESCGVAGQALSVLMQGCLALESARVERVSLCAPFARVVGARMDLIKEGNPADQAALRALMRTHGVLIFPGQHSLSPQQEVTINRAFGCHDPNQKTFGFGFDAEKGDESSRGATQHDGTVPGCPAVQVQGRGEIRNHLGIPGFDLSLKIVAGFSNGFHSDCMHDQKDFQRGHMSALISMYCHQAAKLGGQTHFLCARTLLKQYSESDYGEGVESICGKYTMSDLRRMRVHYLNRVHQWLRGTPVTRSCGLTPDRRVRDNEIEASGGGVLAGFGRLETGRASLAPAVNGPVHPLIRIHDETGEEALFLSTGNISHIELVGDGKDEETRILDNQECYRLLRDLKLRSRVRAPPIEATTRMRKSVGSVAPYNTSISLEAPDIKNGVSGVFYSHKWSAGDFVIWDNRLCMHAGPEPSLTVGDRVMHRVRLNGSDECNADWLAVWAQEAPKQKRTEESEKITPSQKEMRRAG